MIHLELLHPEHASQLVAAARESVTEIEPWLPWCSPSFGLADANAWISEQIAARERGLAFEFAIVGDDAGYIGGAGINQVNQENRFANLGYWVRSSKTGLGYATEALRQMVDWAHAQTNLNRLEVIVATENLASQRVAEKAGAAREGIARDRLHLHGVYHDAYVYAFTR